MPAHPTGCFCWLVVKAVRLHLADATANLVVLEIDVGNGPRYAALTAQNAATAVERKGRKAGRG